MDFTGGLPLESLSADGLGVLLGADDKGNRVTRDKPRLGDFDCLEFIFNNIRSFGHIMPLCLLYIYKDPGPEN